MEKAIEENRKIHLRQQTDKIKQLTEKVIEQKKQIKRLSAKVRRRDKKIANLDNMLKDLKSRNFISNEESLLLESGAGPKDFLKRQVAKSKGLPVKRKY